MKNNVAVILSLLCKCGYAEANKAEFKRAGMSLLRTVAKNMGLAKGTYNVRYNAGGIAVSGECTLHADDFYVQISADIDLGILVRSCKGQKDYTGGGNCWYGWSDLREKGVEGLVSFIDSVRQVHKFQVIDG